MRLVLCVLLFLCAQLVTANEGDRAKALGRLSNEALGTPDQPFDSAESRGVFIGVNEFTSASGQRPAGLKSCVNDAVDLACLFMDLGLVEAKGIRILISGIPTKPLSQENLDRLRAAGASIDSGAKRDTISEALYSAAGEAGSQGILLVTWSSHGFEAGGVQFLTPANFSYSTEVPTAEEIQGNAVSEATLMSIAKSSKAERRFLLFDACRESRTLAAGIPQLRGAASGTVTLYAVTSGEVALDGAANGQFTARILQALGGDPPGALKSDVNGFITVGTMLEYLGTAGRVEDPRILSMPLRQDPRAIEGVERKRKALELFILAKQVDLAAPSGEQVLESISRKEFEGAITSSTNSPLVEEALVLFETEEKRADFRSRRSFFAAWSSMKPNPPTEVAEATVSPTATPTQTPEPPKPTPSPSPTAVPKCQVMIDGATIVTNAPDKTVEEAVMAIMQRNEYFLTSAGVFSGSRWVGKQDKGIFAPMKRFVCWVAPGNQPGFKVVTIGCYTMNYDQFQLNGEQMGFTGDVARELVARCPR